ncbi:hypothetical protein PYW07_007427 [Mythimna separata]|uniref:Ankyrin repeat and MYND domain-containing protein 1 n=1 Tax=Mythimna separata TaxID=271217 RepID=A0AAD8E007_MYTSE|nr:hypothetical protein PYW07_007427 [Mythimna separata]
MPCAPPPTGLEKKWPYVEYYIGERDDENRKHGMGIHHWSGAESLETYTGRMLNNTMHGPGEYRWRYLLGDHLAITYEGWFYNNNMHGYSVMSYPDGRVFSVSMLFIDPTPDDCCSHYLAITYKGWFYNNNMHGFSVMSYPDGRVFNGLFHKNYRLGPGVETHAGLQENVGLWHGYQLIRLAWRPPLPSVAIDLVSTPIGSSIVAPHRVLLAANVKIIGQVNSALELLKKSGCEPLTAVDKWPKLYSKNCTDLSSPICHVEAFNRAYYNNDIKTLSEVTAAELEKGSSPNNTNKNNEKTIYYAWNNNKIILYTMKHCFTHEEQRRDSRVNLEKILSGPRSYFKRPAKHEMDCRSILMASYLGNIANVAKLINESDVTPNVTDVQGNSVLMYAACGDQRDIIHFLVEAGADVDAYNDACCTPLAITLLRFALETRGVTPQAALQAVLPPTTAVNMSLPRPAEILEWNISRESQDLNKEKEDSLNKVSSKTNYKQVLPVKKGSVKDILMRRNTKQISKQDILQAQKKVNDVDMDAITDAFAKDKLAYDKINTEYMIRVAEEFSVVSELSPIPYIFEVNDMYKDVELFYEEEIKKNTDKSSKKIDKTVSRPAIKETPKKPSRDVMYQEKEDLSVDAMEEKKQEKMDKIMSTILQLLSEGADPRKARCPQPPLFMAAVSESAELVRQLIKHGADVHEVYPQTYDYTTLDVAVSGPLTPENLEVVRALLQSGASPDHRLKVPPPSLPPTKSDLKVQVPSSQSSDGNMEEGPNLLHALLTRKIDTDDLQVVEIRDQLLELLLRYGCNPITQYKGHSAVDMVLNRNLELFDIFVKSPHTDLNAIINDSNQTILVKMFYLPYCRTIPLPDKLQMLTNLLLFGADPLIKCRNGDDEYDNLFSFVKSVLSDKDLSGQENAKKNKNDPKAKKNVKRSGSKTSTKVSGANRSQLTFKLSKANEDYQADYKQALDLVVECARLLYIRWLQAKLMKELIEVVNKYKYRNWTMILKEHKNKKCTSLWLNAVRGLEIWDVLKTTKKKIYNNDNILKQVLCIIHFYSMRTKILRIPVCTKLWFGPPVTFQEKEFIEREVARLIREHWLAVMSKNMAPAIRPYVAPELTTVKEVEKFNVCFECVLPLGNTKIPCDCCNLVAFCSYECIRTNIDRFNCHPCSDYLKEKYFPTPEETEINSEEIIQDL